jgi:hypothetical protein
VVSGAIYALMGYAGLGLCNTAPTPGCQTTVTTFQNEYYGGIIAVIVGIALAVLGAIVMYSDD